MNSTEQGTACRAPTTRETHTLEGGDMKYDPGQSCRRSIRLNEYDYTRAGVYFVTICAWNRECLFGNVVNSKMCLSSAGNIVAKCWNEIPCHFADAGLDVFTIMPNHIHGILSITDRKSGVGARHAVPLQPEMESFGKPVSGSIPTIIRSFKSAVTKRVNEIRGASGLAVWQRNYYEHIVSDEKELNLVREYIINNPKQWELDRENPLCGGCASEGRTMVPLSEFTPLKTSSMGTACPLY